MGNENIQLENTESNHEREKGLKEMLEKMRRVAEASPAVQTYLSISREEREKVFATRGGEEIRQAFNTHPDYRLWALIADCEKFGVDHR